MFSLNEAIYFVELIGKFLEMNIIPWTNIIASNDYTFLWINICPSNEYISLQLTKYIISLKLNKYNSMKLLKYTVAGCKIMPWVQIYFVECDYMYFLIFALFTNGKQ